MRDHACAGPQLAHEPRLDALVERRTEVERDDSGGAQIRREEIALDELDEVGHSRGARAGIRFSDELWIDFDPDTPSPVLLRRGNHDPSVPDPRSYTMSALVTLAAVSIASTTSGGVATKRTSGTWLCASAMRAMAPVETASGTNATTMSPILPTVPPFSPIICRSGTTFTRSLTTNVTKTRRPATPKRGSAKAGTEAGIT